MRRVREREREERRGEERSEGREAESCIESLGE